MTASEVRAGAEFRVSGRTLAGSVMTYGDVSLEHGERFAPGAFAPVPAVPLNVQHDAAMTVLPAGDYELIDTPQALEIRAELPARSGALALVRRGALNGFSVEFHSRAEHRESGVRVIERAALVGVGLVDMPSYPGSTAELRAHKRLAVLRGRIPVGERVECRCGPKTCTEAIFKHGAFRGIVGDNLSDEDMRRDVLAVVGDYSQAIGSVKRKSVRFWEGEDGGLEYAVDIPDTARGRELLETAGTVDVFGRPTLDMDASKYTIAGKVAEYTSATVRAMVFNATDAAVGWAATTVRDAVIDAAVGTAAAVYTAGKLAPDDGPRRRPRRRATWLP